MAFIHNPFYLVGASKVIVSVLPQTGHPISGITVYWRSKMKDEEEWPEEYEESNNFQWKYNDFQCVVDVENGGSDWEHDFFVIATYNDGTEQDMSPHSFFFTEALTGACHYNWCGACTGSAQPTSTQEANIKADMAAIIALWNDVGMPAHTLNVYFDSRHETAYCDGYGIYIGPHYASGSTQPWERMKVYFHELRHYCGVDVIYGAPSAPSPTAIPHTSKPFRDYQVPVMGLGNYAGNYAKVSDNYDYCIDDIAKFYFGSPVAHINLNYEHSSFNDSSDDISAFILKALISTQSLVKPAKWIDSSLPRAEQYIPKVKIVGMDAWIDDAHKSSHYPTVLQWTYINKDYTLRTAIRPEECPSSPNYGRLERTVTSVYVGDPADSSADKTTIGTFYSRVPNGASYSTYLNVQEITLNPNIKTFQGFTFQDDIYLTKVTMEYSTNASWTMSAGMFKGCTSLLEFHISSPYSGFTKRALFANNKASESGLIPNLFTIYIPYGCNPALWKTGDWSDYNIVPEEEPEP